MNCPQCKTELPDSATYCVKCGTPIRPASFSYLPAGSPSWPTTMPQNVSYTTEVDASPIQTDAAVHQAERSSAPKIAARPKKSRLSIPAIIALFVVSILIGGGATLGILYANGKQLSFGPQPTTAPVQIPTASASSTATPTAQAQGNQLPTPTSFQTISSTELGVSLKYPSDWLKTGPSATQSKDIEVSLRPQQQLGMEVLIRHVSQSNSANITNTSAANQADLAAFSQIQGVTNLQATTTKQTAIGGAQWTEQDATFSDPNNIQYDFVSLAVQHGRTYFTMDFYSPDMYYKEAIQKYFQPMFDSFKFLS
jgi:hypothetical protein